MRTILFLFIFVAVAFGQQPIEITDFSGGLVRLMDPYDMPDNAAREYTNVSIKSVGGLSARDGYVRMVRAPQVFRIIASEPRDITELSANYRLNHKSLVYHRGSDTLIGPGGVEHYTHGYYILKGGDSDTLKYHWVATDMLGTLGPNNNIQSTFWLNNLFLARDQTPMLVYDGEKMYPAAPVGPGEPIPTAVDSVGDLTGCFRYVYVYSTQNDGGIQTETSPESRTVCVTDGKIYLRNIWRQLSPKTTDIALNCYLIDTCCSDSFPYIKIYRKDMLDPDAHYGKVTWINSYDSQAWDNTQAISGFDTLPSPGTIGPVVDSADTNNFVFPNYSCWRAPGSPVVRLFQRHGVGGQGVCYGGLSDTIGANVAYAIAHVDSAGRWSRISGFTNRTTYNKADSTDTVWAHIFYIYEPDGTCVLNLDSWDQPPQYQNVVKKLLITKRERWVNNADSLAETLYFVLDTLDPGDVIYDSDTIIPGIDSDNRDIQALEAGGFPQWYPDDSLLGFDPSDMIIRGSRTWVIGDGTNLNRIYYSSFGRPTTFPNDHYIDIESNTGDWLIRIWPITESIILFRNNSIVRLSGLDFFSFRVDEVSRNVGLTAVNSLAGDESIVFFAHESGIYATSGGKPQRISLNIQTLWDSLSVDDVRWSVGRLVDREYWLSIPNNYTLVFNSDLQQWRKYDFIFDDLIQFDYDSGGHNFTYGYFFVRNDTAFELTDTVGTDHGSAVVVEWQSKTYFAEEGRVRVNYIDFEGQGGCDSISVYGYLDNGATLAVKTLTDVNWFGQGGSRRDYARDNRITFKEVVNTFSFKIEVYGPSNKWLLNKMTLNYTQWDEGIE